MVSSRASLLLVSCVTIITGAAALGCADPEADFDEFTERARQVDSLVQPAANCDAPLPAAGQADGEHFTSLTATKLGPDNPIVAVTRLTTTTMGDGLDLSMTLQLLSKVDRRTPVGDPIDLGTYQVAADASFVAALPRFHIPAEALSLTDQGADVTVTLSGNLCSPADFICGDMDGSAVVDSGTEVNLDGSAFTMQRIDDPAAYPEPLTNCAREPARPLEP